MSLESQEILSAHMEDLVNTYKFYSGLRIEIGLDDFRTIPHLIIT